MSLAVRFQGIEKQFGPVRVLHGVSFDLAPGCIYGLLGENDAGKSTLMKILAGYERANAGELFIDERDFASSRDAEHAGIVLIHQELNLADHLSIVQNMFLGHKLKGHVLRRARDARGRPRAPQQRSRPAQESGYEGTRSDRRGEVARRDSEGDAARGASAHHGRADRDAHAIRDAAPLRADGAPVAFEVEGASVSGWAHDVSFSVREGEVFGFAELVGAGRTELFEALVGLRQLSAGRIVVNGETVKLRSPRDAMRHGLTYLRKAAVCTSTWR